MGQYDRKNFIISVKLRESCSDKRIIDWQLERDYSYTPDEVNTFETSILPHYNLFAEKILDKFLKKYKTYVKLKSNKSNYIKRALLCRYIFSHTCSVIAPFYMLFRVFT